MINKLQIQILFNFQYASHILELFSQDVSSNQMLPIAQRP
jgi:hypothetical protein